MSLIDRFKGLFGNGGPEAAGSASGMISCHEALELIHEFLDGELEEVSEAQVRAHFDVCQACYPQLRLEGTFRAALRRACRGEGAPEELKARVSELLASAEE